MSSRKRGARAATMLGHRPITFHQRAEAPAALVALLPEDGVRFCTYDTKAHALGVEHTTPTGAAAFKIARATFHYAPDATAQRTLCYSIAIPHPNPTLAADGVMLLFGTREDDAALAAAEETSNERVGATVRDA